MDTLPLVAGQLENGRLLLEALSRADIAISAACWVLGAEEDATWFFYLATPLVRSDGDTKQAYRRIYSVLRQASEIDLDTMAIRVIAPAHPMAQAVNAIQQRGNFADIIPIRAGRIGDVRIAAAYAYSISSGVAETNHIS